MSIFSKLFKKKEDIELPKEDVNEQTLNVTKTIDTIINILANLGLLHEQEIASNFSNDQTFDLSILKRMMIDSHSVTTESLEKYFNRAKLGYGSIKLKSIRLKLENYAAKKIEDGQNNKEVVEELIEYAKDDVIYYGKVLEKFNANIEKLEENSTSQLDLIAMLDYWTNYYKEQELGYPINLATKIDTLALELMQLPYGGFGIDEISKFKEAAYKKLEEGKLNNEESHHTLSRILTSLFNPKKEHYLEDVESLEKKIQMINESPELSDLEKQQRRLKTIKEFNIMNGHREDLDTYIEQLRKNLSILEYGGYGINVLDQFSVQANGFINAGKKSNKSEDVVRKEIHDEYQKLVDQYQKKLVVLKEKTREIDQSNDDDAIKDKKKSDLIDAFHDEMGLPINHEQRIACMISDLKELERGGYGEIKIKEFSDIAYERLKYAKTKSEIRDALRDLNDIKDGLVKEYQLQLNNYYETTNKIMKNKQISPEEKQLAINDCEREFKFAVGYRMNFDKYIENRLQELANLDNHGYGEKAIFEFRQEFKSIASSDNDDKEKYMIIKRLYNRLKQNYYSNVKLFDEWKRLQKNEKWYSEKEIEKEASYMLSLSPRSLRDYLLEDDKIKKMQVDKHNYEVAFKYLAKEEAADNQELYNKRLEEFANNIHPYDKNMIDETIEELQFMTVDANNSNNRIISVAEYIDSTLMRQIMYAEANITKESE